MDFINIKHVQEICSGPANGFDSAKIVNAYLALGWTLMAIHQRGNGDGSNHTLTVYILASQDSDAEHPTIDQDAAASDNNLSMPYTRGAFLWG